MPAIGRKSLALLLTLALVFSLVGTAAAETQQRSGPPASPFWDTYSTRYQEAVDALYALGVVAGKTANSFEPQSQVTRAQMAALVIRALGQKAQEPDRNPFPDVPKDYWAAAQIALASQMGIVRGGTDGFFRPEEPVTYAQLTAMVLRALALEGNVQGEYPTGHVILASSLGLIDGLDWGLDKPATRGDVAVMLYRAVFRVKVGGVGPTLSQMVHQQVGYISIEPSTSVIAPGAVNLKAKTLDWVGNDLQFPVTWSVVNGNATISNDGRLSTSGDGQITVKATAGQVSAEQTYTVIRSLEVTSDKTAIKTGTQVQLTARGTTASGQQVDLTPVWSVTSGSATVTEGGLVTVTGPSAVTVKATVGALSKELTLQVVGGLTITSGDVTLATNDEFQFAAQLTDATGKRIDVPVKWAVTGGGVIDQTGRFRAGSTSAVITAEAGGMSATVNAKVITRVEVSPSGGTFKKGDTKKFTAVGYTATNEQVAVPVQWSVEPSGVGFFSADNSFFAANSGSGQAVAKFGSLTARVPVTVAGPAVRMEVTASPATLPANGSASSVVTVRLVDANGQTAIGVENALFSISNQNLGSLTKTLVKFENGYASTTLTAGTAAGSYSLLVSAPGTSIPSTSMTFTTTAPSISHVALEVYPNPLSADGVSQTTVTATLVDTSGAPVINNTGSVVVVNLNASNTAAGRLASQQVQIGVGAKSGSTYFIAGSTPGTTVITGTSNYSVRSVSVSSQIVGGAYRLRIRSGIPTVRADGTTDMPVYVEVLDGNGNIRTGDNSVIVAMNATSGTNTIMTASQQSYWGVATFRLRTTTAGTYNVSVWALNQGLQGDNTQVTFTPGSAYKLALSVDPSNSLAADGRTTATLRARILDVNNNLVVNASNQVRFVRQSGSQNVTQVPSVTSVVANDGVATLQITSTTGVGTDHFVAEADGLLQSPQVSISTRITGVPIKVQVSSLSEPTIAAGATTTVRVWVMDQLNQLVTGDNGRVVTLTATNGATVSGPAVTVNGVATFTVTSTKGGAVGLTASGEGVTADQIGRVLNIAPGTPDHIVLAASPEALSADGVSRTTLTAKLVDKYGNATTGSYSVNLSLSTSEHLTLTSPTIITGGQVQVIARTTPGTTVISGTVGGYVVTPLTISTYQSGVAAKVVIDNITPVQAGNGFNNQVVVKARVLDSNGNLVTSLNTGSELTAMAMRVTGSSGTNTTNISMNSTSGLSAFGINPNGITIGSATVTAGVAQFTVTNTRAETVTFTPVVFYRGVELPGVPATMTTIPGAAARITLSASATAASTTTPTNITITAAVTDAWGNPVSSTEQDTITFTSSSTSYLTLPASTSVRISGGAATISATTNVHPVGGTTVITAASSRLGYSNSVSITTDLEPARPTVLARDNNGSDTFVTGDEEGARISVVVPVRNSSQKVYVYVNGVIVPLYTGVTSGSAVDTITQGGTTLVGYIKKADLGGSGIKEIRAVVETPLGMSPLSDPVTLNVQNY